MWNLPAGGLHKLGQDLGGLLVLVALSCPNVPCVGKLVALRGSALPWASNPRSASRPSPQ